ncbi:MAG: CBS domain-containing protein [Crenarchaeota archaeon]|nr:CBS domain-containing protein [Thermoproteota archaeon]
MRSIEKYFGRERMIITIDEDATIGEAVELMHENGIGALLVTRQEGDKTRAAGILTERDVIAALALGADPNRAKVKFYMTPWRDVITVTPDTPIEEALKIMITNGIRHLVVVDGEKVVGLISMRDLCAALLA